MLSDLLTNIERASDHCSNIAVSVIEECSGGPGRHAYLQEVKAGGAFGEDLRRDRKKYHLPEAGRKADRLCVYQTQGLFFIIQV